MIKAEVHEPHEVDSGGSMGEPQGVAFDTAVAQLAVLAPDEPGDRALDHRTVLPVGLLEAGGASGGSSGTSRPP